MDHWLYRSYITLCNAVAEESSAASFVSPVLPPVLTYLGADLVVVLDLDAAAVVRALAALGHRRRRRLVARDHRQRPRLARSLHLSKHTANDAFLPLAEMQ